MLIRKLNLLPSYQKHIFSLIVSILCLAAAIGLSCLYSAKSRNPVNTALVFVFFLILASCNTAGYFYGILYSLLAVLYFFKQHILLSGCPAAFLSMLAITIFVSALASRLALQADRIAEKEKQLAETEMEKMRANLLRAISHDLRTPLTGIIGNSAVFLDNQMHLSEDEKRNIVSSIHEDSKWLINMADNLLSITRIGNRKLRISINEESVEEVVAEALQRMKRRHPECIVRAKIPEEILLLPMDALLIEQVVFNLLENALYHAGSSGPIDFFVEDAGGEVSFTVRDYGAGIPDCKLNHLFDGMNYTDPHSADTHKGIGIGLALCMTIITAHHGTLAGKNHNCGAEFTFTLPREKERIPSRQKGDSQL